MTTDRLEYIADNRTCEDWRALRAQLVVGGSVSQWERAAKEFYFDRLEPRYLEPIRTLQANGGFRGEGFAIVAIQCSLIEFLESTIHGINYVYKNPGPYEYSQSKQVFESFLANRKPFAGAFSPSLASSFYVGVRCGMLHEARTKDGWRIHGEDQQGRIVDEASKILFRNGFQRALLDVVSDCIATLPHDESRQAAFLRKYDRLCA